jgi:hypothetical protein
MTDKPNPPTSRFLFIELNAEVTRDFCLYQGKEKAYALLHRNGSYLQGETGPIVTATWADAVLRANIYGATIIANFHEEKIKHERRMPAGGVMWDRVLFQLHKCARDYPNTMPSTTKEPDAYGRSQTSLRKAAQRANVKHKERVTALTAQRKKERFEKADRAAWGPDFDKDTSDE